KKHMACPRRGRGVQAQQVRRLERPGQFPAPAPQVTEVGVAAGVPLKVGGNARTDAAQRPGWETPHRTGPGDEIQMVQEQATRRVAAEVPEGSAVEGEGLTAFPVDGFTVKVSPVSQARFSWRRRKPRARSLTLRFTSTAARTSTGPAPPGGASTAS